ncbi:MAG: T9SS type A sorting domain-containing protein [Taibaiella sp.]|nr:T9SS type A sorting domain-containing protein [Taibaiella sp.]
MKNQLLFSSKCASRYVIIVTALIVSILKTNDLNAQISYHDIVPDVVLSTWNAYTVIIDSSALGYLTIWDEFGSEIDVTTFDSTCQVMFNGSYPSALNAGDVIGPLATWQTPNYSILNNGVSGHWVGMTNKYLGVKTFKAGQWEYGWIRLDVNSAGNAVTIKDYACNKHAGNSMQAGQMSATSVQGTTGYTNAFDIYPNPSRNGLLQFAHDFNYTNCTIYNINGLKTNYKISNHIVDISALPNGQYIVEISSDDIVYRKVITLAK